jgi:hypothetical protein
MGGVTGIGRAKMRGRRGMRVRVRIEGDKMGRERKRGEKGRSRWDLRMHMARGRLTGQAWIVIHKG